jgi:hypothetical protein
VVGKEDAHHQTAAASIRNQDFRAMKRGTIFLVLFVVVAAGIIGLSQFLNAQPPFEVTIAVDPLAQSWLQEAINALNTNSPTVNTRRVQFKLSVIDDLAVWQGDREWTPEQHPAAWVAASGLSVTYAAESGLPLETLTESLARTPLVWGGYVSRERLLTTDGTLPLDWSLVAAAAAKESWVQLGGQSDWGFVKLGFGQPSRKIGGLAAMLTAAASFNDSPSLAANSLNQQPFRNWLLPVIKSVNFNTLGADPAAAMARGPSVVELGMFPEAQWLLSLNGIRSREDVRLSYPAYQFVLDFPLARWRDANTSADQLAAIETLRAWLESPDQQARLTAYGLRPASAEPTEEDALFSGGAQNGVLLTPDYGQAVQVPLRNDAQGLIQWITSNQ